MQKALEQTIKALEREAKVESNLYESRIRVNESLSKATFYYEKLRQVLEYQDEHLFLKNAVKRILKRHKLLRDTQLAKALLHELVWAHYFKNDTIPTSYIEDVDQIIRKYDFIRSHIRSKQPAAQVSEILLALMSVEIEQFLSPAPENDKFYEFIRDVLEKNITLADEVPASEVIFQIEISIRRLLFKFDRDLLLAALMRHFFKFYPNINKEEAQELGALFDEVTISINQQIEKSKTSKIFRYIKRNTPPFVVLWEMLQKNREQSATFLKDGTELESRARAIVSAKNRALFAKVWRATVRGVFFILLTKVVLAFLIELPYETKILGQVNYFALVTNTVFPPILMIVTSFFVRIPGRSNTNLLTSMLCDAVFEGELKTVKLTTLKTKKRSGYIAFNAVTTVLALAIVALVAWGLYALKFNAVSIVLFFVFVSLVSFIAFRIRATARELEVRSTEDSVFSGVFSFVLLPFIIIGKSLSDKWSQYNFTLFFWDFIVEAPFKTIIGVFESWLSFVREKGEDFE